MYCLVELPEEFHSLADQLKELSHLISSELIPAETDLVLEAESEHFVSGIPPDSVYLVTEGVVRFQRDEVVLFLYEQGDIIGLPLGCNLTGFKFVTDFAIKVDRYSRSDFDQRFLTHPEFLSTYHNFLSIQVAGLFFLSSVLMRSETFEAPTIHHFSPGEVMIAQGSEGDEVYTLIEGHADVFVDGVRVGEVLLEETFGVLAALTGTPRTAQVVATKHSLVTILPKDRFVELIGARPGTILKVVEDMARTIVDLNAKVVALSGDSTSE